VVLVTQDRCEIVKISRHGIRGGIARTAALFYERRGLSVGYERVNEADGLSRRKGLVQRAVPLQEGCRGVGWGQRKSEWKPNFDRGVFESVSKVGWVIGVAIRTKMSWFCGAGVETNFLDRLRARAWQPATHEEQRCWDTSGQATHAEIPDRLFKRRTCRVLQA
jgi:hypothetical protein